jgi:hypothetical protein
VVKNGKAYFPSPHIASVSYSSNGKILNTTVWLTGPFQRLINNNSISSPFITDSNISQVLYRIEVAHTKHNIPSTNKTIIFLNHTLSNFKVDSKTNTTFAGTNPATTIVYEYTGKHTDVCKNCKATTYLALKDNMLYRISIIADAKENPVELSNLEQRMLNHTTFQSSNDDQMAGFRHYQNSTYRIYTYFPDSWQLNSTAPSSSKRFVNIIEFYKPSSNIYVPRVRIFLDSSPPLSDENLNLKSYLDKTIADYRKDHGPSFSVERNGTLLGKRAFTLTYTYARNKGYAYTVKSNEIGTIIGTDRLLIVRYSAILKDYADSLQVARHIIKYLDFNPKLRDDVYGLRIEYPSNWTRVDTDKSWNINPDDIARVEFYSPVNGPYAVYKYYDLGIDYDSAYGRHGNVTAPYIFRNFWNNTNQMWLKQINEYALDGQGVRIWYPNSGDNTAEYGKRYVPLNLNLTFLNLPAQFYIFFFSGEEYIKDGQRCLLTEQTNFFSVPPPHYSISLLPSSLKMRAGNSSIVAVNVQSPQNE